MDGRVVAGIVGLALAGCAQACPAQVGPDPSGLPPVSLAPIDSISDSINGNTGYPGRALPPSPNAPTNPTRSGPPATLPRPPIAPGPVMMRAEPPLMDALQSGYRTGPAGSMPRGIRPSTGGPTRARAVPPSSPPGSTTAPAPPANPSTPPGPVGPDPLAPSLGRPAPFAGQSSQGARPRAGTPDVNRVGRPAPPTVDAASSPPRPSPAPAPEPIPSPSQLAAEGLRPTLDAMPPVGAAPASRPGAAPPPEGSDPLGNIPTPLPPPEPTPAPDAPPRAPEATRVDDPAVKKTGGDATAIKLKDQSSRDLPAATLRAAAVGDEVITFDELNVVVSQRLEEMKGSAPESGPEKRQFINMVASHALDSMIDQAVIIQEAKRRMRNPKSQQMFDEFVDKTWRDEELPPLLRKTATANEYELKRKLAEQGKSYDVMKTAFHKKMLARDFLGAEIRNKVTCDLAEQRAYYNEHLSRFEQPARFTWREIEVAYAKHPNRAAARQKADAILARLNRGEDFDAVAKEASDGPTASKGGLYPDMTPGSYGIPVVNDELNRLPVGQTSAILEAPNAFHIVRVESRRDAGPLRFDEVQDKIRPLVMERNYQKAVEAYLTRLRSRTLIRTMFDNSASDPTLARRNDPKVQPVSNR